MKISKETWDKQKAELTELVNQGKSISEIAELLSLSTAAIKRRKRKFGLTDKDYHKNFTDTSKEYYTCLKCNQLLHRDLFNGIKRKASTCKKCFNNMAFETRANAKKEAIAYKGGKCEKCGYDKYHGALDFHHTDPTQKDFDISRQLKSPDIERYKDELDKCILLCSNCHREEHARLKGRL